jgi:2-hydroxychromene-2-carboxylate isomerase
MSEDAAAYVFRAPLTVCLDVKNPHAYLALAPTLAMTDELDIEVEWLPLRASPLARPVAPGGEADRGERHRWHRARYQQRDLERAAEACGVALGDPYRAPDSTPAAAALLWVKRAAPDALRDFLPSVFGAYWREALDIESASALRDLLSELDVPVDGFEEYASGPGRAECEALGASLRAAGTFSVPTYWVGGEPFLGRQHLPMIRRLLTGGSPQP